MSRALAPQGGNDKVYTPDAVAQMIVQHFKPSGRILEPCAGQGAFVRAMEPYAVGKVTTFEIDEGRDFLGYVPPDLDESRFDWCVTNPPWSQFRPFLKKAMEVSDHVVFLSLVNAFFMRARVEDMKAAGFGIVEIAFIATPPKPWPQTGFQLGATHLLRGYAGPCRFTVLRKKPAAVLDLRGSEVLDVWSVREDGRLHGVAFEEKDAAHVYAAEEYRNRGVTVVKLTMTRAELNRLREYEGE